uniref:Uncharacterized protein n=1 Tax=Arundo donax TaxID=35708 RepID=A0A0A8YF58_ARUDO
MMCSSCFWTAAIDFYNNFPQACFPQFSL